MEISIYFFLNTWKTMKYKLKQLLSIGFENINLIKIMPYFYMSNKANVFEITIYYLSMYE